MGASVEDAIEHRAVEWPAARVRDRCAAECWRPRSAARQAEDSPRSVCDQQHSHRSDPGTEAAGRIRPAADYRPDRRSGQRGGSSPGSGSHLRITPATSESRTLSHLWTPARTMETSMQCVSGARTCATAAELSATQRLGRLEPETCGAPGSQARTEENRLSGCCVPCVRSTPRLNQQRRAG